MAQFRVIDGSKSNLAAARNSLAVPLWIIAVGLAINGVLAAVEIFGMVKLVIE